MQKDSLHVCFVMFSNNKNGHLERHLQGKHATFAADYPVGRERKSAIAALRKKLEQRKGRLKKRIAHAVSLIARGDFK